MLDATSKSQESRNEFRHFAQYSFGESLCFSREIGGKAGFHSKENVLPGPFEGAGSGALAPRLSARQARVTARIMRDRGAVDRAGRAGLRFLACTVLERRLDRPARTLLRRSIRAWLMYRGVAEPLVLAHRENSERHGLHDHWLVAVPSELALALARHVEAALARINGRAPPARTLVWSRPRRWLRGDGGRWQRVSCGWSLTLRQAHGWVAYTQKHWPALGETLAGVRGRGGRRDGAARSRASLRPAPAPARRRATDPRPIAAVAQLVAVLPPASQERSVAGDNSMSIQLRFDPIAVSEGGRSAVRKSVGLTAAAIEAWIETAHRRGTKLTAEQVTMATNRVGELIQQARSPAQAAKLRKVLTDVAALRPVPAAVAKAAERAAVPPAQDPTAGPDHAAELAAMEARTCALVAKAPAAEKPRLEALLADIAAMRAALQRGAVLKGGLHPLRRLALARAEVATRSPVEKRAGGGVHPLLARARARAAGGRG